MELWGIFIVPWAGGVGWAAMLPRQCLLALQLQHLQQEDGESPGHGLTCKLHTEPSGRG